MCVRFSLKAGESFVASRIGASQDESGKSGKFYYILSGRAQIKINGVHAYEVCHATRPEESFVDVAQMFETADPAHVRTYNRELIALEDCEVVQVDVHEVSKLTAVSHLGAVALVERLGALHYNRVSKIKELMRNM